MAEIAILRRVRENREREEMARTAARWGACEKTALLFGRAIFGGFFLYNGINHFLNREMMTGYSASKGVPYPEAAVAASGAMLVLGGALIAAAVPEPWLASVPLAR